MGYDKLDGNFFMGNPDTGEMTPLGWIGNSGLTSEDTETTPLISQIQQITLSFKITGHAAEKARRAFLGLPYMHPRQVLHNGKKPR